MILTNNPLCLRIRHANARDAFYTAVGTPGIDAAPLRDGGCDIGVTGGRMSYVFSLEADEMVALRDWLSDRIAE